MIEIAVKHQTLSNLKGFCPKEHRKNQRKCPTFLLKEFEKNLFLYVTRNFGILYLLTYYILITILSICLGGIWFEPTITEFCSDILTNYQAMKLTLKSQLCTATPISLFVQCQFWLQLLPWIPQTTTQSVDQI